MRCQMKLYVGHVVGQYQKDADSWSDLTERRFVTRIVTENIMTDEHYKHWLEELETGDKVVVEQPAYRFRYYLTTVSKVTPDGISARGFSSVVFNDGACMIGKYEYFLLEPTNEIIDKINTANCRRLLNSTDWYKVEYDTVLDVYDLVYGD